MSSSRLIVVEDDSILAMELQHRLEKLGHTVVATAARGDDAIRMARELCPDLVLMDIRLRGPVDGIQAADEIRARLNTPIIYVSAYADDGTLQRAKVTEPYGYILKPFGERELHSTIELALYRREQEGIRQRNEELEFLNVISATVSSTLDLQVILNRALNRVLSATAMAVGSVHLVDSQRGVMVLAAHHGLSEEMTEKMRSLRLGEGLAGRAADSGEPAIVEDVTTSTDVAALMAAAGSVRSLMVIPMASRERVQGVMCLAGYQPRRISAREVRATTAAAQQIAMAIENARLYEEAQQRTVELQKVQTTLVQAERLAAMNQMAVTVRHEINNPLTAVLGNVQWLLMDGDRLSSEIKGILQDIQEAALRIGEVVQKLDGIEDRLVPYVGETTMVSIDDDGKRTS